MDFVKVEGLGNDFIVVDGPVDLAPDTIAAWCDRRFGIGADGVLEMTPVSSDRIRMRYWNADGGEAEMCGNGLRCLVKLAVERRWVDTPEITVETAAGPLPATLRDDGMIRAKVGSVSRAGDSREIAGETVHPVSVGNPHAVVFVDDPGSYPVREVGRRISSDPSFPGGANVEFVTVVDSQTIEMRIWERGVGETLASGTGATAAAYAAFLLEGLVTPVRVRLRGGELVIEFSSPDDLDGDEAWMTGPGNVVYRGSVEDPSAPA